MCDKKLENILNSKWILNGQQACFHSAMRSEYDVSDTIACLHVLRIYRFVKEIKLYICALYIIFLFVKSEKNRFTKATEHVLCTFTAWWNPRQSLWEFSSRWKQTASQIFTDLFSNSPKRCLGFHQVKKVRRKCFIS